MYVQVGGRRVSAHISHKVQNSIIISNIPAFTMCVGGDTASRIALGGFTSVVVHQDQVYAAENSRNETQVFQRDETSRLTKTMSINHEFTSERNILTLSISNNQLKCCSYVDGVIKVYSLLSSGELLQSYDTHAQGGAGHFYCSVVSDSDDDGSVLIADWSYDRLQVMSEQGEFSVLQLQPPVPWPRSAVLFNNQLYVTKEQTDVIYRYSC